MYALRLLILDFFPGPTALLKGPTFIKFTIKNWKNGFFRGFYKKDLKILPNIPFPTVIQGPRFIPFAKVPGPTFISCPTSIPGSRVGIT